MGEWQRWASTGRRDGTGTDPQSMIAGFIRVWDALIIARFSGGSDFACLSVPEEMIPAADDTAPDVTAALLHVIADAGLPPPDAVYTEPDADGGWPTARWQIPRNWNGTMDCLNWEQRCARARWDPPACCGLPLLIRQLANWSGVEAECLDCGRLWKWIQPQVVDGEVIEDSEWWDNGMSPDFADPEIRVAQRRQLRLDEPGKPDLVFWPIPVNPDDRSRRPMVEDLFDFWRP